MTMNDKTKASEEQIVYANLLNKVMWFGLALLIITFLVYISGLLPTKVPINDLPLHWGKRVHIFNQELGLPTGWGWLKNVGKGDYLNFVGIAILSGLTIACYAVIMPIFKRKKDTAFFFIALAEVLVLLLAASGILKSGGH
jgi:hypothetical protein